MYVCEYVFLCTCVYAMCVYLYVCMCAPCVGECVFVFVCVHMHVMFVNSPKSPEEAFGTYGGGVTGGCEPPSP